MFTFNPLTNAHLIMKRYLLLIFAVIFLSNAKAQCPAPELVNWNFIAPTELEITFNAPAEAETYSLKVVETIFELIENPFIFTGPVTAGLNTFTIDPTIVSINGGSTNLQARYYSFEISVNCALEQSDSLAFYASFGSMLNWPGFSCNEYSFQPLMNINDVGESSTLLNVQPEDSTALITNMTIFIDLYHTFNQDFDIKLKSPTGTEIILKEQSGQGTDGFSVLFDDQGSPIQSANYVFVEIGLSGVYAPVNPLSTFIGEPIAGDWEIIVNDYWGGDIGILHGVCLSFETHPCNASISGNSFYDLNLNGIQEIDEPNFNGAILNISDNYLMYCNNGSYFNCLPDGSATLEIINPPTYYATNPLSYTLEIEYGLNLTNLNFGLHPIPGIFDLEADFWTNQPHLRGFNSTYKVNYGNVGTECLENAQLQILLDPNLVLNQVFDFDYAVSGNSITVELGTLCPTEAGTVTLSVHYPQSLVLGSTVTSSVSILPLSADQTPANNYDELSGIVVGSYDPNDKQVDHEIIFEDFLNESKYLDYLIRFQNTGTYYAINVLVEDSISTNLDLTTFQLLNHSHPVEVEFIDNVIHFVFADIMLPDSTTNEPESHGYVRFRIKPYQDITLGTIIPNTAYIYFDFNEAIITNTTQTIYSLPTSVMQNSTSNIKVFPNPATSTLNIAAEGLNVYQILIYDLTGRIVKSINLNQAENFSIPVHDLPAGTYLLQAIQNDSSEIVRWIKQ
jgi:subtilisin-like proprotein convertase family protein